MKLSQHTNLAWPARRTVIHAEALAWMSAHPAHAQTSVVTSLPDVSEVALNMHEWKAWFVNAAATVIRWIPQDGLAIFFQSDIRCEGMWVDKGYLIMKAAEEAHAGVVWHKIVCRKPPGTIAMGRASYSHMICIARTPRSSGKRPGADVLADAGAMSWSRAMGAEACREACRFLRDESDTRIIVDPFCGKGSILKMANVFGFEAIGVDLSIARCRSALQERMSETTRCSSNTLSNTALNPL